MTNLDSQKMALNRELNSLNEQRDTLRQYKTAKASTLSAMQVNRWNYNFGRVLAGRMDGLEGEISQEYQRQNPTHQTNGFWIPNDVLLRDLSFGDNAGLLVSPDLTGPKIVDGLRPLSPVLQLGVEVQELPTTGTYTFPREQSVPQITFGTENQTLTPTSGNPSFDQTPATKLHRASNVTNVSRQLAQQAQVQVGIVNWFATEVRRSVAQMVSTSVLAGTGSANNQPLGIVNLATGSGAVNSLTVSSPTKWSEIVAFDSTLDAVNAYELDANKSGWVINGNTRASWAVTPRTATQNTNFFLYNPEQKTVNGHRCFVSNEVGNFAVYASRWDTVLVVLGGAVSVLVDPFTQAASGITRVVTDCLLDVVFRRPEALATAVTTF